MAMVQSGMGQSVTSSSQAEPGQSGQEAERQSGTGSHAEILSGTSAMAAKQNIFGLIDPRREVRRAPLVGMQFLHEGPMGTGDVLSPRAGLKAKDLMGLLLRHFSAGRSVPAVLPRSRITLRVFTPAGLPAVKIRHE
jgi:hypothetical protein